MGVAKQQLHEPAGLQLDKTQNKRYTYYKCIQFGSVHNEMRSTL